MRYFRFLVAGYTVSAFGSHLNLVALGLYAYVVTGSALRTGLFMALRLLAAFLTGLTAGAVVARFPRKRVMITADLTQATALLTLALTPAGAAGGLLYGVAVVTGGCQVLSTVSLRSGVPSIVGQQERVRANALLITSRAVAMVAGFAGAGIIVSLAGFTTVFLINAATFAVAAANLSWLPVLREVPGRTTGPDHPDAQGRTAAEPGPAWRASLVTAGAVFRAAPVLLIMILVRTGDALGSSSHIVSMPVYASTMNPAEPAVFLSQFWTAWAVGNILTQQLVVRLVARRGRELGERSFALGTTMMSALFIVAFTGVTSWTLFLVALGAGLADGFTETAYLSRLQTVDERRRGAVFGLVSVAETAGLGLGMVVSAVLLDQLQPPSVVAMMHGFAIVLALTLLGYAALRLSTRRSAPVTPEMSQ